MTGPCPDQSGVLSSKYPESTSTSSWHGVLHAPTGRWKNPIREDFSKTPENTAESKNKRRRSMKMKTRDGRAQPNRNPVRRRTGLLLSWYPEACETPSMIMGMTRIMVQYHGDRIFIIASDRPAQLPRRIPRHREQNHFSSPKNRILRSFLR